MGTSNTLLKAAGAVTGLLGGFLTGLWEIFLSPTYVGSTLIPLSPVLAAVTNVVLIRYVRRVTGSATLSLLPGVVWFATMIIGASGGPGGDVLLPGDAAGRMGLIAILVGAAVWAIMAYRQVLNRAAPAGLTGPDPRRSAARHKAADAGPANAEPAGSESAGVDSSAAGPAQTGPREPAGPRPKSPSRRPSSKSPRPGGRR